MRLAVVQCQPPQPVTGPVPDSDPTLNERIALLKHRVADASRQGAGLLLVPEAFLSGYHIGNPASQARALPDDSAVFDVLSAMALQHRIALAIGYIGQRGPLGRNGSKLANCACLIDATGQRVLTYDKTHLFGQTDRSRFEPGGALSGVAEIDGIPVALAICYDIEFPELARSLALAGARLILVPTASMLPYDGVPLRMVPARAEENGVFIAYANYCGNEREFDYAGLSCIVGPDGLDMVRAGANPDMLIADLDPRAVDVVRGAINYHVDRRPSLYRL